MRIKQLLNGCNSVHSVFFVLWRILTPDLMSPQSCKCCIFWRGFFIGIALSSIAVITAMLEMYKATAIYLCFMVIIALVVAIFGDSATEKE